MSGYEMSFLSIDTNMSARERIANALRSMRLTAKEIARSAGVSPRSVVNWRAANADMSLEALARLCREHDDLWREFCAICERPATVDEAASLLDEFAEWRKAKRHE